MKKGYQPAILQGISKVFETPEFAKRPTQDLPKNTDSLYNVKRGGAHP
jgi:hypothetical protein